MARKFLYLVALAVILVVAGGIAFQTNPGWFAKRALLPTTQFKAPVAQPTNAYASEQLWFTRPGLAGPNPVHWQPDLPAPTNGAGTGAPAADPKPAVPTKATRPAAIFYVHPTTYYSRANWNAPLDDTEANGRATLFIQSQASAFAPYGDVWIPRYRQATLGAFLTADSAAQSALDAAYRDVLTAFDHFARTAPKDRPIILAGHSQGALHLMRLIKERIAGKPLARRVAVAYLIGWPISMTHDVPALGLAPCAEANSRNCIVSWSSFAEPADPGMVLAAYAQSTGLDGKPRGDSAILCTNPLTGTMNGTAPATANLGTLFPKDNFTRADLIPAKVGARCDERGLLLIGTPPDMGSYVLPGNNYHVYDYALFWSNLRADVAHRLGDAR